VDDVLDLEVEFPGFGMATVLVRGGGEVGARCMGADGGAGVVGVDTLVSVFPCRENLIHSQIKLK
jgi:hypothetical protein